MFLTAFLCFVDFSEGRAKPTSLKSMCSDLDWGTAPPPPPAKIERRFLQILILFYIYIHIASNWYCKRVGLQVAWLQHLFFFRNICIYGPVEIYLGTQTTYLGWVVFGWWVGVIQTPPPPLCLSPPDYLPPFATRFIIASLCLCSRWEW